MTNNSFTFGQLLGTSFLSIIVGVLVTVAAITTKPHTETAAATVPHVASVASVSPLHAVVIVEAPTVAHVEVMPEATTATATTTTAKAAPSEAQTISDEDIQAVKQYCNTHRINAGFAELHTEEPPLLVAAK